MDINSSEYRIYDPSHQILFFTCSGIIGVIMNSLAFYIIWFKSGNIGTYKYYLMYYQVVSFLADIHVSLLIVPAVYLPVLLCISNGIYWNWFKLSTHYQLGILFALIVTSVAALICSFIRKHQSVAAIGQKYLIPSPYKYILKVFLHVPVFVVFILFVSGNLDKTEEMELGYKKYPDLIPVLSQPNAELYSTDNSATYLTVISMVVTFTVFIVIFLSVYFQIIQMLHSHRHFMAAKTYSKHIAAVVSLVAQLVVLLCWLAIPIGLLLLDVMLVVTNVEVYLNMLICLYSTHSTVSTIVMSFTFPSFRRFICCQDIPLFSPGTTVAPFQRVNTIKIPKSATR